MDHDKNHLTVTKRRVAATLTHHDYPVPTPEAMALPTNVLESLPVIVAAEAMFSIDLIGGLRGFEKLPK